MDSRSLTKLINHSFHKHFYQVTLPKLLKENTTEYSTYTHPINPDIWFLRKVTPFPVFLNKECAVKTHNRYINLTSSINFCNKSRPHRNLIQFRTHFSLTQSDTEPFLVQDLGWAGQPIIKRIHPILPEVYGDVSDIFYSLRYNPLAASKNTERLMSSETKTIEVNNGSGTKNSTQAHTSQQTEKLKHSVRSHDNISVINNKLTSDGNTSLVKDKPRLLKKHQNPLNTENVMSKSGVIVKSQKKKIKKKKKTKVMQSSPSVNVSKIKKKRKSLKVFGVNKTKKINTNIVLNQRFNTQSLPKNYLLMESRHIQTDSTLNYPKLAIKINLKENVSKINLNSKGSRKGKNKSNSKKEGMYADDCVCPETLEKRDRKGTQVCGTANDVDKKKEIKKWKPKMCLVERKIKQKRKTFVCPNKLSAGKGRKRKLPTCPKPEKKEPPRSVICPPRLDEQKDGKKKKCEKQVEEVKIRKRTKVCRPVILFGKEETQIKIEKSVCTDTRVKKKISRHTSICPPPQIKNKKQAKN